MWERTVSTCHPQASSVWITLSLISWEGCSSGHQPYAEAMLLAYNRKCKYPLKWTKLYEKNVGNNEGLDIDTDMDEDEGGDSFEGAAKE